MYLRRLWSSCLLAKAHDDGNGLSPLCLSSRRVASSHEYILIHPLDFYQHTPVSIFSLFSSFFPNLQICIFSTIFSQPSTNLFEEFFSRWCHLKICPYFGFFQYTSSWVKLLVCICLVLLRVPFSSNFYQTCLTQWFVTTTALSQLRALCDSGITNVAILSFSGAHSNYPSRLD